MLNTLCFLTEVAVHPFVSREVEYLVIFYLVQKNVIMALKRFNNKLHFTDRVSTLLPLSVQYTTPGQERHRVCSRSI